MADAPVSKKPADTPFKQQKLKAWQPILTPKWVIFTFMLVGAIFLPIGIAVYLASAQIQEITVDYTSCVPGTTCSLPFVVPSDMVGPVYVYYQLTNFYQNHRRYVQSRSDVQLRYAFQDGENQMTGSQASSALSDCSPATSYTDGATGKTLYYYPCGLVALSWFNDTFTLTTPNNYSLTASSSPQWYDTTGLAWPSDIDKKFIQADTTWMRTNCFSIGPPNPADYALSGFTDPNISYNTTNSTGVFNCWHNVSDQKFIVWMRTAGLPDFKKLYANIQGTLPAGTYTMTINSRFPVTSFNGTKSFVLSTTRWIGGKNNFLGIAYLVVGSLCMLMGAIFLGKHLISPRTLGDQQYLVWKQ